MGPCLIIRKIHYYFGPMSDHKKRIFRIGHKVKVHTYIMARTKQTAHLSTGGEAPRKQQLVTKAAGDSEVGIYVSNQLSFYQILLIIHHVCIL